MASPVYNVIPPDPKIRCILKDKIKGRELARILLTPNSKRNDPKLHRQ